MYMVSWNKVVYNLCSLLPSIERDACISASKPAVTQTLAGPATVAIPFKKLWYSTFNKLSSSIGICLLYELINSKMSAADLSMRGDGEIIPAYVYKPLTSQVGVGWKCHGNSVELLNLDDAPQSKTR